MRVTQMVTDLIRESMLTTRGDMVRRGATEAERFAAGLQFQALYMYDDDPTWIDPYYYLTDEGAIPVMGSEVIDEIPPAAAGLYLEGQGEPAKPAYTNPFAFLTTQGDLVIRGAAVKERLAAGVAGTVLKGQGAGQKPIWQQLYSLLTTQGDIIVRGAATAERLAAGGDGYVLTGAGVGSKPAYRALFPLLTTKGDIWVKGNGTVQRLAAGALGHVLYSWGVGELPYFAKYQTKYSGLIKKNFTMNSNGSQQIRGVGFKPSVIIFICGDSTTANMNFSIGLAFNAATIIQMCLYFCHDGSIQDFSLRGAKLRRPGMAMVDAEVTDFVSDGFNIVTTLNGVASGNVQAYCIG